MIQSSTIMSVMRNLRAVPSILCCFAIPAAASDRTAPPVQPASSYAAVETHPDEKISIAAEPYDTKEKESIFRVDYLSHGVMPVRLIVTNNGTGPSRSATRAFSFMTAAGDEIQAAQPEDVERLMTRKEREGGKIPLPGPCLHQAQAQGQQ